MRVALAAPLVALGFLTSIPVALSVPIPPAAFPRAVALFPLVGTALGLLVAGLDALARATFSVPVASVLDLAAFAVLTGALHLDGLADAADGLLPSGVGRARRLALMRSGTSGPFGVTAIALTLLLEGTALAALEPAGRVTVLVVAPTAARWSMAVALWAFPYARPIGLGRAFKEGLRIDDVAAATALALIVVFGLGGSSSGALVVGPALAVVAAVGILATRRLGGITGDVCGAIGELTFAASVVSFGALSR